MMECTHHYLYVYMYIHVHVHKQFKHVAKLCLCLEGYLALKLKMHYIDPLKGDYEGNLYVHVQYACSCLYFRQRKCIVIHSSHCS